MTHEDDQQAILDLERRALDRWSAGDPMGYAQAAADDLTYFDDIGAQSRVDGIEACREYLSALQGQIPPHEYEIVNPGVQLYGEVGILTLRYHASVDGEAAPPWKATSVYRRIDGEWKLVHANWSLVKDT